LARIEISEEWKKPVPPRVAVSMILVAVGIVCGIGLLMPYKALGQVLQVRMECAVLAFSWTALILHLMRLPIRDWRRVLLSIYPLGLYGYSLQCASEVFGIAQPWGRYLSFLGGVLFTIRIFGPMLRIKRTEQGSEQ